MTLEEQRFREEATRIANLTASDREAALDVHRRIADDTRLSEATRNHARTVGETLERLVAEFLTKRKHSS